MVTDIVLILIFVGGVYVLWRAAHPPPYKGLYDRERQ
jgi:uncharacterized membrane protein